MKAIMNPLSPLQRPVWVVPLALCVALAAAPAVLPGYLVDLLTKVMVMAIFAMSLDLLVGCTGLVSLGHAAFLGIAAYATAWAVTLVPGAGMWLALPCAILAATLGALAIGALALRTHGVYFIMITLAFSQMFMFVFHDTKLGGSSDGMYLSHAASLPLPGLGTVDLSRPLPFYLLCLAAAFATYAALRRLIASPLGRAFTGIHLNEQRMRSLGYPVQRYKLASFVIGGGFAGLAGYLSAAQYGFVSPDVLSWHHSGLALLMVIIGGGGRIYGAAIGAAIIVGLQDLVASHTNRWQLMLGLTIVVIVMFAPGGVVSARWPAAWKSPWRKAAKAAA